MGKTYRNYEANDGRDGAKRSKQNKHVDQYRGYAEEEVWNAKPKKSMKKAAHHHNRQVQNAEMEREVDDRYDL